MVWGGGAKSKDGPPLVFPECLNQEGTVPLKGGT